MKNYIKISIAICLSLISNNAFASQPITSNANIINVLDTLPCCFQKFVKADFYSTSLSSDLQSYVSNFFGKHVSPVAGTLYLARATQSFLEELVISRDNDYDEHNESMYCKCILIGGCTLFITNTGTLAMGSGSTINIVGNSKLLISGKLNVEPNCTINIGSEDEADTGGYLIINAEEPIDLSNLTINLFNKNSHLEIHGNDIKFSNCKIYRYNDQATAHTLSIPFVQDFAPVTGSKNVNNTSGDGTRPNVTDSLADSDNG